MRNIFLKNKNLATPSNQGADFVELFFDLVFVYAITRIKGLTAHHFDVKHVFQSVLVFLVNLVGMDSIYVGFKRGKYKNCRG